MSKKRLGLSHKVLFEDITNESFLNGSERDLFSNDSIGDAVQCSPALRRRPGSRRASTTRRRNNGYKNTEEIFENGFEISNSHTSKESSMLLVSNANKWKNWRIRALWTFILLGGFFAIISAGHAFCALLIVGIQMFSFREVINLTRVPAREKRQMRSYRLLSWYFLVTSLHFFYGDKVFEVTRSVWIINRLFLPLARHHRFISFSLYIAGLIFFVLLLEKGHYKFQFFQFFWTHMTLLVVVVQSHFVIHNVFEGLVWFIMPATLVIVNDIMAYSCGFFFGHTPLIQLSPKKTWEGFIGAWLCTSIFGFFFARFLLQFDYMTCSYADYISLGNFGKMCTLETVFIPVKYDIPNQLLRFLSLIHLPWDHVYIAPLQWHALAMALFSSLIAPFGGFFASGFKRAFKIKDFGDSIPGHGGITDRFDCQFLMGLFAYIYHTSFVKRNYITVDAIFQSLLYLSKQDQWDLFNRLKDHLKENSQTLS